MLKFSQAEVMPLFRRMVQCVEKGEPTLADSVYRVPVKDYTDKDRWDQEVLSIFRRRPLPLAFTCEMREPLSYRALDAVGVPVLITRTKTGEVRAFINSCRHRGLPVVENGSGKASRFTCRYHGWSYRNDGSLLSVSDQQVFGNIEHQCYGLLPLPVEERSGMIWVVLTPGAPLELDRWLGDFGPIVDKIGLADFELYSTDVLESPNWKVTWEGYSETYHFASLHPNSFATHQIPNMLLMDEFGPHRRFCFPRRGIDSYALQSEDKIVPVQYLGQSFQLFPCTQFAFGFIGSQVTPGIQTLVSQVFPTTDPGHSVTIHRVMTSADVRGTDDEEATRVYASEALRTVRDEDYPVLRRIQTALESRHNDHFLFGRNEPALQHFHRSIDRFLTEDGFAVTGAVSG